MPKRTFLIFKDKQEREKALDFLTTTNIAYQSNTVIEINKPCFISFAPKTFIKNCIDLYIGDTFINQYSKF